MVDSRVLAGKVPLDQILPRGACHPGIAISDAADVEVIPCLRRSVVVGGREESEVEVVAMLLGIIRDQNSRKGPIKPPRRPSVRLWRLYGHSRILLLAPMAAGAPGRPSDLQLEVRPNVRPSTRSPAHDRPST